MYFIFNYYIVDFGEYINSISFSVNSDSFLIFRQHFSPS